MRYVTYAREFGWTPGQVDELPLTIEPWLLPVNYAIEADIAERKKEAMEKAQREAKNQ